MRITKVFITSSATVRAYVYLLIINVLHVVHVRNRRQYSYVAIIFLCFIQLLRLFRGKDGSISRTHRCTSWTFYPRHRKLSLYHTGHYRHGCGMSISYRSVGLHCAVHVHAQACTATGMWKN